MGIATISLALQLRMAMNRDGSVKRKKVKKNIAGVITIEAAIVLPIVIVTIVAVLYFMKVLFIQNQIQSAMTRTAHDMATYSVIADKAELVDLQQELFYGGLEASTEMSDTIDAIQEQAVKLQENVKGVTDLSISTIDIIEDLDSLDKVDLSKADSQLEKLEAMAAHSKRMFEIIPSKIETMYSDLNSLVENTKSLMSQAVSGISGIGSMALVEYINGLIATKATEAKFNDYISEEELSSWGVSRDYGSTRIPGQIDFSDSHYMIEDDSIVIIARYIITTPLISKIINGVPIYQSVKVRGFTGAYDYDVSRRHFIQSDSISEEDQLYYVSNSEDAQCYHVYTCLNKVLQIGHFQDRTQNHDQTVCSYCEEHYSLASNGIVYYVSDSSKLHYSKDCPKVTTKDIRALTKEEAEAEGYRMCKKPGCTHELFESGQMDVGNESK